MYFDLNKCSRLQALRSFAQILLKSCFYRFYWSLFFKTRVCWFELSLAKTKFFHWPLLCRGYLISIAYWLFSLVLKTNFHSSLRVAVIHRFYCTVKPRYIATNGKREFWRYNEFCDRSRSGFLSVTCWHSKTRVRYWWEKHILARPDNTPSKSLAFRTLNYE